MKCPPLYLLRHGETVWNRERRFQGELNSPLTDLGHAQAAAQGRLLAKLDLGGFDILISPQGRAVQTAAIALGEKVDILRTDDRLREIGMGDWSGWLHDECKAAGKVYEHTPDGPLGLYEMAPNGEGFVALRARCEAFLADLTGPTLCVTHGITSRMLRVVACGLPTAQIGDLPGGQGNIHIVEDGVHKTLSEGVA